MYAIVSLGVTFICYTGMEKLDYLRLYFRLCFEIFLAFLIFGLKPREPEKKKEE